MGRKAAPFPPTINCIAPPTPHQSAYPTGPQTCPSPRQTTPLDAWSDLTHCHRPVPWLGSRGRSPSRCARGGWGGWGIFWAWRSVLAQWGADFTLCGLVVWVLIEIKVGLGFAVGLSHYRFSDGINKKGQPLGEPF